MIARLRANAALLFCLFFLAMNYLNPQIGGTNAPSRFATLQAMSREGTFRIDHYWQYTADWSRTPDGHYFSNKAPGPMFVAYPLTWVMDRWGDLTRPAGQAPEFPGDGYRALVCLVTQMLPFAWLVYLASGWLASMGVSWRGRQLAALAMLFGNTASVYMNSFFGHGMAAWMVLGAYLALVRRRDVAFGLSLGFAVLTDYGAILLIPGFALATVLELRPRPGPGEARGAGDAVARLGRMAAGALLPAALWAWYHVSCFGGLLELPQKYINPEFAEPPSSSRRIWGVLSLSPDWRVVGELVYGKLRGILFTQPWVWIAWPTGLALGFLPGVRARWRVPASLLAALVPGLVLLIWMNASFNGWDGGHSAGPRYLALIFPLFGILAAFIHDAGGRAVRVALWSLLAVSMVLRLLIYIDWITIPVTPLWPYYWGVAMQFRFRPWFKIVLCTLTLAACFRLSDRLRPKEIS